MTSRQNQDDFDRRDQKMLGIEDPGDIDYNKLSREMGSDSAIAAKDRTNTTSLDGSYGLDEADYGSGGMIPSGATGDQFGGVRLNSGVTTVGTENFTGDVDAINYAAQRRGGQVESVGPQGQEVDKYGAGAGTGQQGLDERIRGEKL